MQDHIWATRHQLPQDNRCNGDIAAEDVFTRHLILAHVGCSGRVARSASVAAAVWHRLVASQGSEGQDDWVNAKLGGDVCDSTIVASVCSFGPEALRIRQTMQEDAEQILQGLCVKSGLNETFLDWTTAHFSFKYTKKRPPRVRLRAKCMNRENLHFALGVKKKVNRINMQAHRKRIHPVQFNWEIKVPPKSPGQATLTQAFGKSSKNHDCKCFF